MSTQSASGIVLISPAEVDEKDYKQCTKCHEVKPLSDFHRRNTGFQSICKACRHAHVPSGNKRVVFLNPPEMYAPLMKRIEALESRLRSVAKYYSKDPFECDDVRSAMIDEILFKCSPEDSDARIMTRAKWAVKAFYSRQRAYDMRVDDEGSMVYKMDEDGFLDIDIKISFSKSAEDEYAEKERTAEINAVIDQLPQEYRTIVLLISLGHSQREVSVKLNLSEQDVSCKLKRIAVEFGNLGFSPA